MWGSCQLRPFSHTVEAPPDYKQLFGEQVGKNKESGMQVCDRPRRPRVRPHTRSRRSRTEQSASNTTIGKVLDWIRGKLPGGANRLVVGCKLFHCFYLHVPMPPELDTMTQTSSWQSLLISIFSDIYASWDFQLHDVTSCSASAERAE